MPTLRSRSRGDGKRDTYAVRLRAPQTGIVDYLRQWFRGMADPLLWWSLELHESRAMRAPVGASTVEKLYG
jgi:hypothetical protein